MVKECGVCHHVGELTWRDGKYYCAMCSSEVSETAPQAQPHYNVASQNAECPICKNRDNNQFDGTKYRCALCGTPFELRQTYQRTGSDQFYGAAPVNTTQQKDLKKQKDKYLILAIIFLVVFWPVSIYFFYKFYKLSN